MKRLTLLLLSALFSCPAVATGPTDALTRVRDTAMSSNYAYERLADMTDLIGPRMAGSPGAAAAVTQVADALRKLGARVTLEPVKVPHWERGIETGELVAYAGRPAGITQKVVLTALGSSGATKAEGLTAPVLVVRSFAELTARAHEVKGKIVLFDVPFDQAQTVRGLGNESYAGTVSYRSNGPKLAAEAGAAAALVRSVGGANYRLPHTGITVFGTTRPIPAAAVSAEDAMLMTRLAARGPLTMHLTLTPRTLPEADSYNVIADWPGTDKADEIVIISGHLDSWDLGTGAHDDGAGLAAAMGVLDTFRQLGLHGRRTIRLVAWMSEENGSEGGLSYARSRKAEIGKHFGAIEMDNGAGRPFGVKAGVARAALPLFAPLQDALLPIGASVLRREDLLETGDLWPLEEAGVPSFEPLTDVSGYYDYHHTAADTLDKIDPLDLRRHVAVMASLAWHLANLDQPIGRAPLSAAAR